MPTPSKPKTRPPPGGEFSVKKQQRDTADELAKCTHCNEFSREETAQLLTLYTGLTKTTLDLTTFHEVLFNQFNMNDRMMMDYVFKAFDKDHDNRLSLEEWIRGLSVFLRGTQEEHVKFCFEVYDFNSDGYITREDVFQMLKKAIVRMEPDVDSDESVKELVDLAFTKLDFDGDLRFNFQDFQVATERESLMMQIFGRCLPEEQQVEAFEKKYLNLKNRK